MNSFQQLLQEQPITEVPNPLFVMDRGFAAYDHIAWLCQRNLPFVIRLTKQSFKAAQKAFADDAFKDEVVLVHQTSSSKRKKNNAIPETLSIRLVKVILSNGTVELLATNVMQDKIPTEKFQELDNLRWKVETFFLIVKERLNLENFTGISAQNVLQDFWSTLFLCNLESFLSQTAQDILQAKPTKNLQKVNSCIAFHAIKNKAFDLLTSNIPTEEVLVKLSELFLLNPTQYRKNRDRPRRQKAERRSLNYNKYKKKLVF